MIVRVWIAYKLEVLKAIRLKFTYLGPALVVLTVAAMPLLQRFERDGVSDYAFIAYTTPVALNLVGLILLLAYCASLVSNELASGTIRTLLVRPLRRLRVSRREAPAGDDVCRGSDGVRCCGHLGHRVCPRRSGGGGLWRRGGFHGKAG